MGEKGVMYAMKTVAALREKGIYAETDVVSRSLKAQMKYADKIGAKYVLVVGDNELDEDKATLKNMANRDDQLFWVHCLQWQSKWDSYSQEF